MSLVRIGSSGFLVLISSPFRTSSFPLRHIEGKTSTILVVSNSVSTFSTEYVIELLGKLAVDAVPPQVVTATLFTPAVPAGATADTSIEFSTRKLSTAMPPTVTLPTAPVGPDPNLPPAIERAEVKPDPSKEAPPTAAVQPMNTPEPVPRPEVPPTEKPQVEIPTTPNLQPPSPQTPPSPPTPQTPQNPNSGANGATSPVVSPVTGPPGAPGKGTATGDKSDRESDATSIVDVPPSMWRSGKPLARKGLEIKTKKPELPILTRLTTSPGNPVCEVLFGKDGVPVSCKILQSSGFADIDGPVTDALYRWRAKGSQLEKLAPGKTLTFRIRFILN